MSRYLLSLVVYAAVTGSVLAADEQMAQIAQGIDKLNQTVAKKVDETFWDKLTDQLPAQLFALVLLGMTIALPLWVVRWKKPRLELMRDTRPVERDVSGQPILRDFLRVVVRNTGREEVARNCQVCLSEVHFKSSKGWTRLEYYDSLEFGWAYWELRKDGHNVTHRDLVRGVPYYLDIGSWTHGTDQLKLSLAVCPDKGGLIRAEGEYRLVLIATADNAKPVMRTLLVTWKHDRTFDFEFE